MRMKQRKRCKPCERHKHSECTERSAHEDGRECPCCSHLNMEKRAEKELRDKADKEKKAERRYELQYADYGFWFDDIVRQMRANNKLPHNSSVADLFPKTQEGIRELAKIHDFPVRWFEIFVEEHKMDFANK
jgi:hypothetical protein